MNKAQLIEKLATSTESTKTQVESILDATLNIIQKTISVGDEVRLVGFGTFVCAHRKARTGRNPQTGEAVKIPAGKVPKFRPGKEFKELVK